MSDYDKTFWYLVGQNSNEPRGPSGGGSGNGCLLYFLLFLFFFIPGWIMVAFDAGAWLFILILGIMTYLLWLSIKNDQKKKEEQAKQEQEKLEQQKRDWEKQKQEKLDQEKQEKEKQEDPELM